MTTVAMQLTEYKNGSKKKRKRKDSSPLPLLCPHCQKNISDITLPSDSLMMASDSTGTPDTDNSPSNTPPTHHTHSFKKDSPTQLLRSSLEENLPLDTSELASPVVDTDEGLASGCVDSNEEPHPETRPPN